MLNFHDLTKSGHLKRSTIEWCPDLNGTSLASIFNDSTSTSEHIDRVEPRCRQIFDGDDLAEKDARHWASSCDLTDPQVADLSENCTDLLYVLKKTKKKKTQKKYLLK